MTRHPTPFIACVLSAIAAPGLAAGLGTNLVVNGDAESGDTSGWISAGGETVSSSTPGLLGVPEGESIGRQSFQGGAGRLVQTISQSIDLNSFAAQIDAGGIEANFHVLVQSRAIVGAVDSVTGTLAFLNGSDATVLSFGIVDTHVEIGIFDWEAVEFSSALPVGTRSATLTFTFVREIGASTDAYFDNAELVLTGVSDCVTDLDGDGATDGADLAILLGGWGTPQGAGDVDGDGTVDGSDLAILLGGWGKCA